MSGPTRDQLAAHAEAVAAAAADALPGYLSIVWKGSAVKPWEGPYDFLPGLSDLDLHVYRPGGHDNPWKVRELIDAVGPAPGGTPLQLLVLDSDDLPEWWTLLPGAYRVLHGDDPPVPIPPPQLLRERDEIGLAEAPGLADSIDAEVLTVPDGGLWEFLRSKRGIYPSTLYRVATASGHPAAEVWIRNRTRLLELLAAGDGLAGVVDAGVGYLDAALAAGAAPRNAELSVEALRAGQHLLRTAGAWYGGQPGAKRDRRAQL